MKKIAIFAVAALALAACNRQVESTSVWITSEEGMKCTEGLPVVFQKGKPYAGVTILRNDKRQTIDGFGGSLTESSAFVLACIKPEERQAILEELFGEDGANFSMARTQIGVSDFSVNGKYSYDDVWNDTELTHFSLDVHKDGFRRTDHPEIKDEHYDVYQLMTDVAAIKARQEDKTLNLVASPWSPPAWMKDNEMWYDKANRRGGALKPEHFQTFANYFVKYLEAYRADGIEFWAVTPENEPMGNDGSWESLNLPPEDEARFIGQNLGPTLEENGFGEVKILGFDQNTFEAGPYVEAIYGDDAARQYTDGMALHWYGSTVSCFPEVLDSLHNLYPDKCLLHTEGCIDNLGCDAWEGVRDPAGFKESGWWLNDSFWWNKNATDWAYSTPFWPDWHPAYAPVHRYAQYIIDGVNHWMTGYIDWNIVLDSIGGPNHVSNFCGAQVMIDHQNDVIYYTPYYYALKQISRAMRPGDVVLGIEGVEDPDLHICAVEKPDGTIAITALNTGKTVLEFPIHIGKYVAYVDMYPNSLETIFVKL